jgi:AcrR family transcriptional regulator
MRKKARKLREQEELTIDEIAKRLGVSRTTVFFWVGDMQRPKRCLSRRAPGHAIGNKAMQAKYRRLREEAYHEGIASFEAIQLEEGFVEFVTLFIAEGYKRNRNVVSVANSDPAVIAIADQWMRRLSRNRLTYSVQYHADQNLRELQDFWAALVGVEPDEVRLQRKSNSNQLTGRTWRSEHGASQSPLMTLTSGLAYRPGSICSGSAG